MNKKTLLGSLVAVLLILVGGYYAVGFYIFNTLTVVAPRCEINYMEAQLDNTPIEFIGRYRMVDTFVEQTDYAMANYETVTFPSREDNLEISA